MGRPQLFNEGADIALYLQLRERVLITVLHTLGFAILVLLPHSVVQSLTPVPLVLLILAQSLNCAIHLVRVKMVSIATWRRFSLLHLHPLIDLHGGRHFLLARILNHRDNSGSRTR